MFGAHSDFSLYSLWNYYMDCMMYSAFAFGCLILISTFFVWHCSTKYSILMDLWWKSFTKKVYKQKYIVSYYVCSKWTENNARCTNFKCKAMCIIFFFFFLWFFLSFFLLLFIFRKRENRKIIFQAQIMQSQALRMTLFEKKNSSLYQKKGKKVSFSLRKLCCVWV